MGEREDPKEIVHKDTNPDELTEEGKKAVDEVVATGATTLRIRGSKNHC
jgi:hypothetical protein